MSDMYTDITPRPGQDNPRGRSCPICNGPLQARGGVYLAPIEATVCRQCSHDLLEAMAPKAETIPVHSAPQAHSGRKSTMHKSSTYEDTLRQELEKLLAPYVDKDGCITIAI